MRQRHEEIVNALEMKAREGKFMLSGKELVDLGIVGSEQTLRNYRWQGKFLRYYRIEKSIKYSIPDIIKYLNENKVEPK